MRTTQDWAEAISKPDTWGEKLAALFNRRVICFSDIEKLRTSTYLHYGDRLARDKIQATVRYATARKGDDGLFSLHATSYRVSLCASYPGISVDAKEVEPQDTFLQGKTQGLDLQTALQQLAAYARRMELYADAEIPGRDSTHFGLNQPLDYMHIDVAEKLREEGLLTQENLGRLINSTVGARVTFDLGDGRDP